MISKKIIVFISTGILLFGSLGFLIWWKGASVAPALLPPPQDVVALLNQPTGEVLEVAEVDQGSLNENSSSSQTDVIAKANSPFRLPPGFSIEIFASNLATPRVLAWDERNKKLLVSVPSQGIVVALADRDGDGRAEERATLLKKLNHPHGLALMCEAERCLLYVAEAHRVMAYSYDGSPINAPGKLIAELPDGGRHVTRSLLIADIPAQGKRLLISVGSACDACEEKDTRRGTVLMTGLDGGEVTEFASGLRNAVFLARHPQTGEVWVTEMGRDFLGDNLPPDEINIVHEGKNYGWPFCYGKNVRDTRVVDRSGTERCTPSANEPSLIDLPAHSAPLGLAFVPSSTWPEAFHENLLVAFHGSWNRSEPTGYSIVRLAPDGNGGYSPLQEFASGWLIKNGALGRPVDLVFHDDALYVSDDKAGVIYRIRFSADAG